MDSLKSSQSPENHNLTQMIIQVSLLPSWIWVLYPVYSKVNLLTPGVMKENAEFIVDAK